MKVTVYQSDEDTSQILLLRSGFYLSDVSDSDLSVSGKTFKTLCCVKDSKLFSLGVDVSQALPALISRGYFVYKLQKAA